MLRPQVGYRNLLLQYLQDYKASTIAQGGRGQGKLRGVKLGLEG